MNFNQLIAKITPEIYQNLKTAVEIGRWPSGDKLTEEQQANSLQAVLAYEIHANIPDTERVGYIDRGRKKEKIFFKLPPAPSSTEEGEHKENPI